jgi:hypothetical protein
VARRSSRGTSRATTPAGSAGRGSPACSGEGVRRDDHGCTTQDVSRSPCARPVAATRHTGRPRRASHAEA